MGRQAVNRDPQFSGVNKIVGEKWEYQLPFVLCFTIYKLNKLLVSFEPHNAVKWFYFHSADEEMWSESIPVFFSQHHKELATQIGTVFLENFKSHGFISVIVLIYAKETKMKKILGFSVVWTVIPTMFKQKIRMNKD